MPSRPRRSKRSQHPDLTRRVRLVMAWNRFVFYHRPLPTWLGWNLTIRKPGCILVKDRRP